MKFNDLEKDYLADSISNAPKDYANILFSDDVRGLFSELHEKNLYKGARIILSVVPVRITTVPFVRDKIILR